MVTYFLSLAIFAEMLNGAHHYDYDEQHPDGYDDEHQRNGIDVHCQHNLPSMRCFDNLLEHDWSNVEGEHHGGRVAYERKERA